MFLSLSLSPFSLIVRIPNYHQVLPILPPKYFLILRPLLCIPTCYSYQLLTWSRQPELAILCNHRMVELKCYSGHARSLLKHFCSFFALCIQAPYTCCKLFTTWYCLFFQSQILLVYPCAFSPQSSWTLAVPLCGLLCFLPPWFVISLYPFFFFF